MSGLAYVAWVLGCGFVLSLALLVIALTCIDELRAALRRERALHTVQHNAFHISLGAGMPPDEVARAMKRALDQQQLRSGRTR